MYIDIHYQNFVTVILSRDWKITYCTDSHYTTYFYSLVSFYSSSATQFIKMNPIKSFYIIYVTLRSVVTPQLIVFM